MADASIIRLTLTSINALKPGETLFDTDVKGLGIRRRARALTYFVKTRIAGRQRWLTIGRHGSPWTPKTARKRAIKILSEAADDNDIGLARKKRRDRPTLKAAADQFLELHGPKLKPRTCAEYKRLLDLHIVPELGTRRIDDISRTDASRLHVKHKATPRQANHILAVLSKLITWCEDHSLRDEGAHPCRRIAKYRENRRERFLTIDEVKRLGKVLQAAEDALTQNIYAIAAIRLLLLTGMRLSEILTLRWEWVDLGRRLILLPDSKTGFKPVALSPPAIEVLKRLLRVRDNPHVIVGNKQGDHLKDLQTPWRALRAAAAIGNCRIHDLRHSYASFAAASGASLPMIGALLVHRHVATTARYTHLANDPLEKLNDEIGALIGKHLRLRKTG